MSKREHGNINGTGETEGPRHSKRRREGEPSSDVDVTMSDPVEPFQSSGGESSPQQIKEKGMTLWTAVKDAVDKDGAAISRPFWRKPPKKEYPDYYDLIKQPIALDDIKRKLDRHEYPSLEAVKNDFELLFANAKQYNQPESLIVQDAKELLKLVHKTYSKMVPSAEEDEKKAPSLNRLMKSKLEKLVAKKDATGRTLSDIFMILPSKKEWPSYYKEIKHPQCLEAIYKHIKRKEYHSAAQFAADVELVFSNALTFNQEHTPIWNDATTLRDYFRQLMSDMPAPHSLPDYAKYAAKPSNKIKIKPPQTAQTVTSGATQQLTKQEQGSSSLFLRVPAAHPPSSSKATPQPSTTAPQTLLPLIPTASGPSETVAPATKLPKSQSKLQTQPQAKVPTPQVPAQGISFVNATPSHYPRAPYVPPPPAHTPGPATTSTTPPVFHPPPILNSYSASQSPAPVVLPLNRQLRSVNLRIQPTGRVLSLDYRDGVKSWAVRLGSGESSIIISNILYLGHDDEEESSADENEADKNEDDMDVDVESGSVSPKSNRRKGKGRGRGRPPKATSLAAAKAAQAAATKASKASKKKPTKVSEIQLKLNNFVVKEQLDTPGEWNIQLPIGSSTIEVGEVGGMIWKVYAERLADA